MDADPLQVFSDLIRFETRIWNALDDRLTRDCALTLGRFEVLTVIERTSPCRVQDIAQALHITWSGASKLVDRLEAAMLCRRTPHPSDGRSSLIALTPAGQRMAARCAAVVAEELDSRLVSALTAQQFQELALTLATLNTAASTWPSKP